MRHFIVLIILLNCLESTTVRAQDNLGALKVPSSPASSMLEMQPNTVLTPKSYNTLETALFSNFTNNEGSAIIPNNFALEFSPYWAKKNLAISLNEYLFPTNNLESIYRNSSISLASSHKFRLGDSSMSNALALGYRTSIRISNENERTSLTNKIQAVIASSTIITEIRSQVRPLADSVQTNGAFMARVEPIVTSVFRQWLFNGDESKAQKAVTNIYELSGTLSDITADRSSFLNQFMQLVREEITSEKFFNELEHSIRNRPGINIDFAYATFISFPTNAFNFSYVPKQSVWITPNLQLKNGWEFLKIMGVLRYEWYNAHYYERYFPGLSFYQKNTDYGLALLGEFSKFVVQLEVVGRNSISEVPSGLTDANGNELYSKKTNSDVQYLGTFSYRLRNDLLLNYTLGNKFDPILNPTATLVSNLTLNLAFGTPEQRHLKWYPNKKE